jgi:cell volume regulation protein A
MVLTIENILLIGSILLFISILAGKTSYRFGVPTLILFLFIGMLAGSEGPGGIYFNDPKLAQFVGIIAFCFILFSGGFETDYATVKPVLWQGITLSTLGVIITAFSLGLFVWYITDFTIYESLLLGSIVSSTDAAAVFSILRSKSVALKYNLRPTLELESGSNDPMANVLTVFFTGLVANQDQSLFSAIPFFFQQLTIGTGLGFIMGYLSKQIINKIHLDFEGLYPVLAIALMVFTFSATDFLGGNGFLAVYITGLCLGNQNLIHKKMLIKAFDGFSWLMQIVLFLTLGLLVFPSEMLSIAGLAMLISLFLMLIARPLSVFFSTIFFNLQNRSRVYLSWVGLRGAVPIVFATYPLVAGLEKANVIFNIVFFISLTSVLLQGTTLSLVAKWLHVALPEKVKKKEPFEIELTESIKSDLKEIVIEENSKAVGKRIVELGLPKTSLIAMIQRNGKYITPNGATVIETSDKLLLLAENKDSLEKAYLRLNNSESYS